MLGKKEPFILVFHDAENQVKLREGLSDIFHSHLRYMDINYHESNDIAQALSECKMALFIPEINHIQNSMIWRDLIRQANHCSAFSMVILIDALAAVEIDEFKVGTLLWVLHCSMVEAIEWIKLGISLFCIANRQDISYSVKELTKSFSVNGSYRIAVAANRDESCGLSSARQAIAEAKDKNFCDSDAVFFHIGYGKNGLNLRDAVPVCALIEEELTDCFAVGWGYGQIPDLQDDEVSVLILWGSNNG